jgi:hypothetical protein
MALTPNYTRIPAPRVSLVDPQTGVVANEWFRFFNNLYTIAYAGANTTTPGTYGTVARIPQITIDEFGNIVAITDLLAQIDAAQIVSGIINTARIQGAYTGITGVGTLTLGTWNATPIITTYGGTGLTSYAVGDLSYYASGTALSKLAIGTSTHILTSSGTAPQWTDPATITVGKATNLVGGAANRIAYQTAVDTTSFIVAPTVSSTYLTWDGTAIQWAAVPSSMVYPGAGIPNSTGTAWGTSYGVSGTGSVALTSSPTFTGTLNAAAISATGTGTFGGNISATASGATAVEGVFTNTNTGTTASAGVRGIANSTGFWLLRQYGTGVTATVFGQTLANYALLASSGASSNGLMLGSLTADPVIFGTNDVERMRIHASGGVSIGNTTDSGAASLNMSGLIYPQQATTAGAPAYVKGAIYFDTTLNKLRVGGATAWETITSI